VKNIGKPCAGEPHARFDEGGLVNSVMERLFRHRQTKGAATDKLNIRLQNLLSTLPRTLLIYQYRLAYSGWRCTHVVRGGESYSALAQGLQNAPKSTTISDETEKPSIQRSRVFRALSMVVIV